MADWAGCGAPSLDTQARLLPRVRGRGAVPCLPQFARTLTEQLPSHDKQLNLLRPLEDVEDLGVARPLLEQLALAVAEAAAELDAAEGDVDAGAARLCLRHRGLQRVRLAVIGHPGRLQCEQVGGLVVGL